MKYRMMQCCLLAALMILPVTGAFAQDGGTGAAQAGAVDPAGGADPAQAGAENVELQGNTEVPKSIYDDPALKPRDMYNLAVKKLGENKPEEALEGFMRARDQAAFDNELRFSSAYNLGHAYAQKASAAGDVNSLDESALQGVIDDLGMSAAWFRDAVKQRPSLDRASGNLEIVLKRLTAARDVMAQKYNTLERQLDAILATERELRENARVLSERIDESNSGSDPMHFQQEFKTLSSIQREALTQTNLTAENLESMLSGLQSKGDDQRTQEESFRIFQLQSAGPLLETARQAMAGARRQMRDLSMSDSLRLTNKAFNYVRQAREQLENPLSILGHIAEDESGFVRIASAKYMFQEPELLEKYKAEKQLDDFKEPTWLNNDLLSDNQVDTLVRTNRLVEFLKNVTEAAAQQAAQGAQQDPQAEAAQTQMEQIKEALPFIEEAASLMQQVTQNLEISDYKTSIANASQSLEKLSLAMERFADLKHLVELTYASHLQLEPIVRGEIPGDTSTLLTRAQQREILSSGLALNRDRIERLSTLLAKEAAKSGQAQQGQQPPTQEQIEQMQKVFEQAEILRKSAADAMDRMIQTTSTPAVEGVDETIVPESLENSVWSELSEDNETAKKSLEQLRIIFFTVIEHIQELYKQQTETMDRTTDAASAADEEKAMKVPPVIDRQHSHEAMSDQLAEILKKQAEQIEQQAAQQQQPQQQGGPDPAEMAQRYREAASELQAASTVMRQVQTDLSATEPLFTESIEEQKNALEHIAKALELLQPPQQQQQQQQNQEQQNQDQQKQQKQKMSKEQAEKKAQQIRERDRERRKNREERQAAGMPIVDKDW